MLPPMSARDPITVADAEALLDGVPLVSAMGGSLADTDTTIKDFTKKYGGHCK